MKITSGVLHKRVGFTNKWLENDLHRGTPEMRGTIVGFSRDGKCARVKWDTMVIPQTFNGSFLKLVKED